MEPGEAARSTRGETYSENLKDPSDDALRAIAARLISKLTGSGAMGTLMVHAGTGKGTVLVDGAAKGTLDAGVARVSLPAGQHTIAVRVPGFEAEAQSATISDGSEDDMNFTLAPEAEGGASSEAGRGQPDRAQSPSR